MSELIILVDPDDKPLGESEKMRAHQYAMLHRAFSVLVFRHRNHQLEVLLQQRNKNKYHAGGLWTNTCCSHPHPGEDTIASATKRLKEEMGIETSLKEVGVFHYVAPFDNGLTENEIDHVLIGFFDADIIPINTNEVENYKWIDIASLQKDLAAHPSLYTPWFKQALAIALSGLF
jgi:isopentenyl-diphosphate Delta-isomerase